MLWTSDVVKDPWFPLVKDPSGSMSSYHLSRFTPRSQRLTKRPLTYSCDCRSRLREALARRTHSRASARKLHLAPAVPLCRFPMMA